MNNKAWIKARDEAGLTDVRVHDLGHTIGIRLRAQGGGLEDRQDLLGHYSGRMTTHCSRADIKRLIDCVELLCRMHVKPELTLVKCA
jgi:integrase